MQAAIGPRSTPSAKPIKICTSVYAATGLVPIFLETKVRHKLKAVDTTRAPTVHGTANLRILNDSGREHTTVRNVASIRSCSSLVGTRFSERAIALSLFRRLTVYITANGTIASMVVKQKIVVDKSNQMPGFTVSSTYPSKAAVSSSNPIEFCVTYICVWI